MIRAILAHDDNWGIGKGGTLPWPTNKDDLRWFKENTDNDIVVMGRKTWESLPVKPLPNRKNIVVSTNVVDGADITVALKQLKNITLPMLMNVSSDIWIIGGAQLVESCLDVIDELWLNNVGSDYNCDTFLPRDKILDKFIAGNVEIKSFGTITKWVRK